MKQTLLIITALMLVVGFTSGQEPIDGSTLIGKDGLKYHPDTKELYSGVAVWYYDNGQKRAEGTYKDGRPNGKVTAWHENGQKGYEGTYKDGELDGLSTTWYENGQKNFEVNYKDGELISEKEWNEDGSIKE
jgi:antitoxin component YwqK of YwqJK toxin-antitoxin module